jgi:hypothetical protein
MSQKEFVIVADTVDEAREKAKCKIPLDPDLLLHRVESDGSPKVATGMGVTVEDALKDAHRQIPEESRILKKKKAANPTTKLVKVEGDSKKDATEKVLVKAGERATVTSIQLLKEGSKGGFLRKAEPHTYKVTVVRQAVVHVEYQDKVRLVFWEKPRCDMCKAPVFRVYPMTLADSETGGRQTSRDVKACDECYDKLVAMATSISAKDW